ncbi:hypothetical protein HPB52_005690 [Rhipicephalus sanguineus]|uniref:Uncharacterized protein n=1 Tax=Rhipicephalus sanguineus TaxID=34632 RepID=A0A9D4SS30_RHISA|nr:hypothetical protein HPB52_005690 [Rhipicephalus sanguineus]
MGCIFGVVAFLAALISVLVLNSPSVAEDEVRTTAAVAPQGSNDGGTRMEENTIIIPRETVRPHVPTTETETTKSETTKTHSTTVRPHTTTRAPDTSMSEHPVTADTFTHEYPVTTGSPTASPEFPHGTRGPLLCTVSVHFKESSSLPEDGLCGIIFYDSLYVKNNRGHWDDKGLDHFLDLGGNMYRTKIGASFSLANGQLFDDADTGRLYADAYILYQGGVSSFGMLDIHGDNVTHRNFIICLRILQIQCREQRKKYGQPAGALPPFNPQGRVSPWAQSQQDQLVCMVGCILGVVAFLAALISVVILVAPSVAEEDGRTTAAVVPTGSKDSGTRVEENIIIVPRESATTKPERKTETQSTAVGPRTTPRAPDTSMSEHPGTAETFTHEYPGTTDTPSASPDFPHGTRGPLLCTVSVHFKESSSLPADGLCGIIFYDSFYVKNDPAHWDDKGLDHFFDLGRNMYRTEIGASFSLANGQLFDDANTGRLYHEAYKLYEGGVSSFGMLDVHGDHVTFGKSLPKCLSILEVCVALIKERSSLQFSLAAYDIDFDEEDAPCPNLFIGRGSFRRVQALGFMSSYRPELHEDLNYSQQQCMAKVYSGVENPCCPHSAQTKRRPSTRIPVDPTWHRRSYAARHG